TAKNKDELPEEKASIRDNMEIYCRGQINFYIQTYTRLLHAAAFNEKSFENEGALFDALLRVSHDLVGLAGESSAAIEGCLTPFFISEEVKSEKPQDPEPVRGIIDRIRFDILAAHGFMLARQADFREID